MTEAAASRMWPDVSAAQGDRAVRIARANPHLRGTGFDLPEVAPIVEEYAAANGVAEQVGSRPAASSTTRCRSG